MKIVIPKTRRPNLSADVSAMKVATDVLVVGASYGSVRTIVWRVGLKYPRRVYRTVLEGKDVRVYRDK